MKSCLVVVVVYSIAIRLFRESATTTTFRSLLKWYKTKRRIWYRRSVSIDRVAGRPASRSHRRPAAIICLDDHGKIIIATDRRTEQASDLNAIIGRSEQQQVKSFSHKWWPPMCVFVDEVVSTIQLLLLLQTQTRANFASSGPNLIKIKPNHLFFT